MVAAKPFLQKNRHIDNVRGHVIQLPCVTPTTFFHKTDAKIKPMRPFVVTVNIELHAFKFAATGFNRCA